MPTVAQIREAVRAKLATVTDIGVVNDYERYATRVSDLAARYVAIIGGVQQLRGWVVRRTATAEVSDALGRYTVTHTWEIRGYRAIADGVASEKEFDTLIEAIRDAFRADETLGGLVGSTVVEQGAGIQLVEHVPVMFADVLCHAARLRLFTRHYQ